MGRLPNVEARIEVTGGRGPVLRPLVLAAVLLGGCYSEPPFIEACQAECACSGDEFACRAPKMGGCDNAYRRSWVLAGQTSQKCQQAFEAYFDCKRTKSVCSAMTWAVPNGACDSAEQLHRECQ